jgi:hypothetical protein
MAKRSRAVLNEAGLRAFARLADGVSRELDRAISKEGLKRTEVAEQAGLNKAALTRVLDGTRNLELRTVAAVLGAIGYVMDVQTARIDAPAGSRTNTPDLGPRIAARSNPSVEIQTAGQPVPTAGTSGSIVTIRG